jgi:3-deoxy-D-manno-octulosonic-acid transferase
MAPEGNKFSRDSVILLDTIGELSACWGLADVAFVGGSFGARQGQNMLEPAAYGAAVLVGPNTANFRDIVKCLRSEEAVIQLKTTGQFVIEVRQLLSNQSQRNAMGRRASEFVQHQSGAVARTIELLTELTESDRSVSHRTAA